jgi:hypothetical protein
MTDSDPRAKLDLVAHRAPVHQDTFARTSPTGWLDESPRLSSGRTADDPLLPTQPNPHRHAIDRLRDLVMALDTLHGSAAAAPFDRVLADLDDAGLALERALVEARDDAQRFKREHLGACETIARIYSAATGTVGEGPRRGVIEDVEDVRRRAELADAALAELEQPVVRAARRNAAVARSLETAVLRWKRARAVHPDTANRALRAARDAFNSEHDVPVPTPPEG